MSTENLLVIGALVTGITIGYFISYVFYRAKGNGLKQIHDQQSTELAQLKTTYNQVAEEKSKLQALLMRAEALHHQSQQTVAQIEQQRK